jgi:hypothetical protein
LPHGVREILVVIEKRFVRAGPFGAELASDRHCIKIGALIKVAEGHAGRFETHERLVWVWRRWSVDVGERKELLAALFRGSADAMGKTIWS